MQRRTFLRTTAATVAGSVLAGQGTRRAFGQAGIADLAFDSTSSLLNAAGDPLTDESLVAVWAEPTATNVDSDDDGDAGDYGDDQRIPLVGVDGSVVGFGAMVANDDADFRFGNEEFLLNVWDEQIGSGTVLWDEGHGQFYALDRFGSFERYAEDNGYTVEATENLADDLGDADGVVVTSPSDAFSGSERDALAGFVDDGGAVFLHDQSDFRNFDETDNLNALASALGAGFRFNDDQVEDEESNAGVAFVPTTGQFNDAFPFFAERDGLGLDLDPAESYEVEVVSPTDGDTVDVAFADEAGQPERPIRVLGIDTPETAANADAERPEEWEGIADEAPQPPEGESDDGDNSVRDVGELNFYSTSSLVDPSKGALTDESLVAVWAEPTAVNEDADGDGDAYVYGGEPIPLAAIDDDAGVVAFGATLVSDGADLTGPGNEDEFLLNVWDEQIGSGTVLWDEGHDQFEDYRLANFSTFESAAEDAGYTVEATTSVPERTDDADGYVVVTPDEGAPFTDEERSALRSFVDDGGVVLCHGVADFRDFDGTATLNGILDALDAGFRYNDDQIGDNENNEGQDFDILTSVLNTEEFPYLDADDTSVPPDAEYPYLAAWGERASEFAGRELPVGARLTLSFDPESAVYDDFGRILGYLTYDATGDGSRDTLYNTEAVRQGYARVYGSSFSRHDEFWTVEDAARDAGTGLWAASNPDDSPPIRDRPVAEIFAPDPASIVRDGRRVPPGHVRAFAESSAEQEGADTTYRGDVPLAAVDKSANVAYLGAPLISEDYEAAEGYPVDTSGYENFAFVAGLVDELAKDEGPVLIEGGHGQFGLDYALSSEDAAYFGRYLEGQDAAFEQVNDLTSAASGDRLDEAKALVVTTPRFGFADAELDAVASFADDGGAVMLVGSGRAPASQRSHLNDVAAGVGSDLRLGSGRVRDTESNLNDDPGVVTTRNFGPGRGNGGGNGNGKSNGR